MGGRTKSNRSVALISVLFIWLPCLATDFPAHEVDARWPAINAQCRPWTYWWWMGSAVDRQNLTRQLELYDEAGFGGVHIIPIYGAKGYEDHYIEYLSDRWMEMLAHTTAEARRLGMGVDMTLGTGWCFGGPNITEPLANAKLRHRIHTPQAGENFKQKLNPSAQAVIAYGPAGEVIDLTERLSPDGSLEWLVPEGSWQLYEIWQEPSGRNVKRAAPGGHGHMLNPFYKRAIRHYLQRFDKAFENFDAPLPRAVYHDSYEYICNWSPDLLDEFVARRGYRLQNHIPALLGKGRTETVSRVKADYRRTISDMLTENFTQTWVAWANRKGFITRNEAHGSPGNLLDLYAAADIPETEFFRFDRNPLIAKFASSAAHIAGRELIASETGTWLQEHFHVTLGHLKALIDGFFVSGINHIIYHGTCYSPADANWPGWMFYASTQMNPRNSIWHDVDALNSYIARCQSVLQSGGPDNDILLYWPIHDLWHSLDKMAEMLTVHHTGWFKDEPISTVAERLWQRGYTFDYVSDHWLRGAQCDAGRIILAGGTYRAVLVPACKYMPAETMKALSRLARDGGTVIFLESLPADVPGLGDLEKRRNELSSLTDSFNWQPVQGVGRTCRFGPGCFWVGDDAEKLLARAGIERESLVDHPGLHFVRRTAPSGSWYFITNQADQFVHNPDTPPVDGWVTLTKPARSILILDPMTGRVGTAAVRSTRRQQTQVYLQLESGQSLILRTFTDSECKAPPWSYYRAAGPPIPVEGKWKIRFIQGGPEMPAPFETENLQSWTKLGDENARRFAGTARYSLNFNESSKDVDGWWLELGEVAASARVRVNGLDFGILFSQPFRVFLPADLIKPGPNRLRVDVTNTAANRIRDLDRRGVKWKNFHDINFVNIDYKSFDASDWPVQNSGLLGPVRLVPLAKKHPAAEK